jgi:hypothetical protein
MRNRTGYLIGLTLLAACSSVVGPESAAVLPGIDHEPRIPLHSPVMTGDQLPPETIVEPPIPPDSPAWSGTALPHTVWGRRQTYDPRRRKLDP